MKIAIGILLTVALAGCALPALPTVNLPTPYTANGVSVAVDGTLRDSDYNIAGITGIATSDRDLASCTITFDILDATGVKVASAMDATTPLKAGQKWRFNASIVSVVSVKITTVEAGTVIAIPAIQ